MEHNIVLFLWQDLLFCLSEVDHVGQRDLIHREEGDSPAVDHSKQNRSLAHTYMVYGFVILRVLCNNKKHLTLFSVRLLQMHIIYRMF